MKCNLNAEQLWKKVEELEVLEDRDDVIKVWVKSSGIEITEGDKTLELIDIYTKYFIDNDEFPTIQWIKEQLTDIANDKEQYRQKKREEEKHIATNGGALYNYVGTPVKLQLNSMLLTKPNRHDYALFSNFRQCGSSIVLVNQGEVLLCVEDSKGNIKVPNKYYLKGNIARTICENFNFKIRTYYKQLQDFLVTINELLKTDEYKGSISPIEDFIEESVPTSLSKLFRVVDYQTETPKSPKSKEVYINHNYKLELNEQIKHFDDIFEYVLNNWAKFKRCIIGQAEFLAWSNDRNVTSSSYWILPEKEVTHCPPTWKKFITDKMNPHLAMRFISYIGMICDASNKCQQYMIISDKGGTGKDFFIRVLASVLPNNSVGNLDITALSNENRFSLANAEIWKTHLSVIHELNDSKFLMSERAKQYFAQNPMDLEVKNAGCVEWKPVNHKTIVFSNRKIAIREPANRRRAIPITFNNRLEWSQELEDSMTKEAREFLDFAYYYYKNCKLVVNGQYIVLAEEDEKEFMRGNLNVNADNWEMLSKRAFTEQCLKDYYNTDEYSNSDVSIDVYDPLIDEYFVITNDVNDTITCKQLFGAVQAWILNNPEFAGDFNCRVVGRDDNKTVNDLNVHSAGYRNFIKHLNNKYSVERSNLSGKMKGYSGIRMVTEKERIDSELGNDNEYSNVKGIRSRREVKFSDDIQ